MAATKNTGLPDGAAALRSLLSQLIEGMPVAGGAVYAGAVKKGRFEEEQNLSLHFKARTVDRPLMLATVFFGRSELFKPWVELYNIQNQFMIQNKTFIFTDSDLEDQLVRLFLEAIPPGGKVFVEYESDPETEKALSLGVPEAASRMGHILFRNGATWFKDWYFSEGHREGGRKLQGEKAITSGAKARHLRNIYHQLETFLGRCNLPNRNDRHTTPLLAQAIKRAQTIIEAIGQN